MTRPPRTTAQIQKEAERWDRLWVTNPVIRLTLVGIAAASTYLLLPLLFRREPLVVEQDTGPLVSGPRKHDQAVAPRPCPET